MTKRYFDIDSTYRNRQRFPNPADFEILLSQSGRKSTVFDAIDPVSKSSLFFPPPYIQPSANYNTYSYIYPTSIDPVTYQIDGIVIDTNLAIRYMDPKDVDNFYVNKYIENISDGSFRKILDYHTKEVETIFDAGTADGSMVSADTDILILGATTIPFTFHSDISDYYVGKKVQIAGQTREIVAYNPSDISQGGLPVITVFPNWEGDPASLASTAYKIFSETAHYITIDSQFTGGQVSTIIPASTTNQTLYRIRNDEIPFEVDTLVGATTSTFTLPASSSSVDDFYKGTYLWLPESNETHLITSYDGSTRTGEISSIFETQPTGGDAYNILRFSYDNFSPLVYSGTKTSVQQMVCYEIELLSLTLPNTTLSSGLGNRIAFYPYILIEFSNLSSTNNHILYSNNPNSTRALFRVTLDDVPTPDLSSFISVDGNNMIQTIKFKPDDNFHFRVLLYNGEVFQTEEKDYFSPSPPNPDVQISATFSIRRVENMTEEIPNEINLETGERIMYF